MRTKNGVMNKALKRISLFAVMLAAAALIYPQEVNAQRLKAGDTARYAYHINIGVMLPLHDNDGDGRRMTEYYRGVLMACDSLRYEGLSVDVHAWNCPEDRDITTVLKDPAAARCDLIIGPLYSKQVKVIGDFARAHNIKVLIPFSINTNELLTNRQLFQVYQSPIVFNHAVIDRFVRLFEDYHPVIIDGNDSTSRKGLFTQGLRRRLEAIGRDYNVTNLRTGEEQFAKAFSLTRPNIVILNTGRSPELNVAFAKLGSLTTTRPDIEISMFGYTEWLMYVRYDLDNFYRFDTYIPSPFYYDPLASATVNFESKYHRDFHSHMMESLPRFALTGFDHAYFFLRGMREKGASFIGERGAVGYTAIQTPLSFERLANGGMRNNALIFIHYTRDQRVEKMER